MIQSDHFDTHPSVCVLLVTGTLVEAPLLRITVEPPPANGLHNTSRIMID